MIFTGDSLFKSRKITRKLIDILQEEYRFEAIKMSMPDMISCHIKGSMDYFPKATSVIDSPMIVCSIIIYNDCIVFSVVCFEAKNCERIIERLNNELLYLKEPISNKINKVAELVNLKILDENDMQYLQKTKNMTARNQILKAKIDEFFEEKANGIISKIIEIIIGIRL